MQLEHWGCPWSREDDGSVAVRPFGGMKKKRTWYAADKSGFHILHTLFQTSLQFPSIERYDEYFALELLHKDGKCRGVVVMEMRSGRFFAFHAPAVIMASGGGGQVFPFTTNGAIKTGDGMAMAYRAGVPLKDMEFVQYHPTGLPGTGILLTEGCRGEGGILVNKNGYRYLQDYGMGPETPIGKPELKTMELGPRDRQVVHAWVESLSPENLPPHLREQFEYDIGWRRPHCPDCNSDDVAKIVYGYPDLDLILQAGDRRLKLGGCCVTEDDPEWHCWQCEREW